jgi:hypothetical protein
MSKFLPNFCIINKTYDGIWCLIEICIILVEVYMTLGIQFRLEYFTQILKGGPVSNLNPTISSISNEELSKRNFKNEIYES